MDTDRIRIELTKQQQQIKSEVGRDVDVLELTIEECEQRIAPYTFSNGWPTKLQIG